MGSSGKTLRRLLAGAALIGALAIGRHITRRRPAINRVADDLRSPLLYLPLDLRSERSLRVVRSLSTRAATPIAPGVEVSERTVEGVEGAPGPRVVIYERSDRQRKSGALLWIHGGGLVLGRPEQANTWCSALAADLDALVVSVDYRLAPEHPFPDGLTDCYDALVWLHDRAAELGVDPGRIAVGGDSAGWWAARCAEPAGPRPGRPGRLLPAPQLPDARRPHGAADRPRRTGRIRVDPDVEPVRMDVVPGSGADPGRRTSSCGAGADRRPRRPSAGVDRCGRARPLPRRGRRLRHAGSRRPACPASSTSSPACTTAPISCC